MNRHCSRLSRMLLLQPEVATLEMFYLIVWSILFWGSVLSLSVFYFRVNVGCGQAEERVLLTGLHAVADIYCESCKTTLGWKYVSYIYIYVVPFWCASVSLMPATWNKYHKCCKLGDWLKALYVFIDVCMYISTDWIVLVDFKGYCLVFDPATRTLSYC